MDAKHLHISTNSFAKQMYYLVGKAHQVNIPLNNPSLIVQGNHIGF